MQDVETFNQQFKTLREAGYEPVWTAAGKKWPSCDGWGVGKYSRANVGEYCGGGIGILTGYKGVVAIDVDVIRNVDRDGITPDGTRMNGMFILDSVMSHLDGLKFVSTTSPTGGRHIIMRTPQGWCPKSSDNVLETFGRDGESIKVSVDIRYEGGFLMIGPSRYPGDVRGNNPWKDDYKGLPYVTGDIIPVGELDEVPESLVDIFVAGGFELDGGELIPHQFGKVALKAKVPPTKPQVKEGLAKVKAPVKQTPRVVRKLLECIPEEQWASYNDWMEIGFATYHSFPECREEALEIWDELSQEKDNGGGQWEEGACAKKWGQIERDEFQPRKGTGTLVQMAMVGDDTIMKTLARLKLLDNAKDPEEEYEFFDDYVKFLDRATTSGEVISWWKKTVRFCATANGGVYYQKRRDVITGSSCWSPIGSVAFEKTVLGKIYVDLGGDNLVSLNKLLATMTSDITVVQVGFIPHAPGVKVIENERFLNTFTKFKADKLDVVSDAARDGSDFLFDHIRQVWCAGNDEHFRYVKMWLATIAQRPEEKTQVALVLKSVIGGVGKGIMCNYLIQKIFGREYSQMYKCIGKDGFLDQFNGEKERQVLAVLDETNSTTPKEADELKNAISEPDMTVQTKGVQHRCVRSFLNFIFTTNNEYALRISPGDRRFFVLECGTIFVNDQEHTNQFLACAGDTSVADAFYTELLSVDLSGFNLQKELPMTEAKSRLQARAVNACEDIFCRFLAGDDDHFPILQEGDTISFSSSSLYAYYKDVYAPAQGIMGAKMSTQKTFSGQVSSLIGTPKRQIINTKRVIGWVLEKDLFVEKLQSKLGMDLFEELTN